MTPLSDRFPWWWGNHYRPLSWRWWWEWWHFVRMWFGWAFRGDAGDWWRLDESWVAYVLPRLRQLRARKTGVPLGLTEEEWDATLDQIIRSMELYLVDDWLVAGRGQGVELAKIYDRDAVGPPNGYSSWQQAQEVVNSGMNLWYKWWPAMWD